MSLALLCVFAAASAALSCKTRANVDLKQSEAVKLSALPRIKRAWSVAVLDTPRTRYDKTVPVADGALFAWSGDGADAHLVALDLATGRERWRTPHPRLPRPQIDLGTRMVFLNHADGETTAIDLETGRPLWTAKLSPFHDHPRDDGRVGFVRCSGPPRVTRHPRGESSTDETAFLLGFDLANGRQLWRRDTGAALGLHAGLEAGNVAIGGRHVYLQSDHTVLMIDPRTGKELSRIALPKPGPRYVVDLETGGSNLAIIAGSAARDQPRQLQAIRMSDGGVVWSRLYPQTQSADDYGVAVRGLRMIAPGADEITEIDLMTGQVAFTHPFPRIAGVPQSNRKRPLGGRLIVLTDAVRMTTPAVVVRWDAKGGAPTLAVLPTTPPAGGLDVVAAADDVVVVNTTTELVGYRVTATAPSERAAGRRSAWPAR